MTRTALPILLLVSFACASAPDARHEPTAPAEEPAAPAEEPSVPPAAPPEPVAEPEHPAPAAAAGPTSGAACATVHIGLDLRALPTNTSAGGIDMFSRGEASDFARLAPAGGAPEIRTTSGWGGFEATFRGSAPAEVAARCQQTVGAYMPTAPRLPIIMEPAAQVVEACHPCASN